MGTTNNPESYPIRANAAPVYLIRRGIYAIRWHPNHAIDRVMVCPYCNAAGFTSERSWGAHIGHCKERIADIEAEVMVGWNGVNKLGDLLITSDEHLITILNNLINGGISE